LCYCYYHYCYYDSTGNKGTDDGDGVGNITEKNFGIFSRSWICWLWSAWIC